MQFIDLAAQQARIAPQIRERIEAVLAHGRYVMGPEINELEEKLASYVSVDHCIAVSSGTDALIVALMALGIGAGDRVATTPFSFISTVETIALLGAEPVFVDIDPRTYNIDPQQLDQVMAEQRDRGQPIKAIMPVSLYGQCAEFDTINQIAGRYQVPVIEDGAQSFGGTYHGRPSCGLTTIGCTSFFPAKPLGCYGEGGACFTNDAELAKRIREIRVHGQDRRYHHPRLGINARLATLQAAILLAKLEIFPDEVEARDQAAQRYSEALKEVDNITVPHIEPWNRSIWAQYTLRSPRRDRVCELIGERGIPTAVHYPVPLNDQPAFANFAHRATPIAAQAAAEVFSLPMHPYLTPEQQSAVVDAVRAAAATANEEG